MIGESTRIIRNTPFRQYALILSSIECSLKLVNSKHKREEIIAK